MKSDGDKEGVFISEGVNSGFIGVDNIVQFYSNCDPEGFSNVRSRKWPEETVLIWFEMY